ncbi:MAG TPA: hypothetical protein VGQ04_17960 [Chitinophagaceae bacterium]|jgi:hypothetical protein|nr:hypothetical protein [Chitinophagaceae bacterium]
MNRFLPFILFLSLSILSRAQKIDTISFHLYTDSLKKGTHNYINIDGKTSDGKWKPLTTKEITFTSSYGEFEGNELILPDKPAVEKISIKAVLRSDPTLWKEITIWIKKKPDDEILPTAEEVLKNKSPKTGKSKRGN